MEISSAKPPTSCGPCTSAAIATIYATRSVGMAPGPLCVAAVLAVLLTIALLAVAAFRPDRLRCLAPCQG
jgi:hypothetical protein